MDVGILDVLGPVMIGPSSSHTAGALRLARTAAIIANKPFCRVSFGLHGSFARTAKGHGTDKALLAGALRLDETDTRIKDIFAIAATAGVSWDFYETELPDAHENSCVITFYHEDGGTSTVTGSSTGGGGILITDIDGVPTEITAQYPTLIIWHYDRQGVISALSSIVARHGINIAVMRTGREDKGANATTVIETDSDIPLAVLAELQQLEDVIGVRLINI